MLKSVMSTTPTWLVDCFYQPHSLRETPFSRRQTGEDRILFPRPWKISPITPVSSPGFSRRSISAAHEFSCPVRVEHAFASQTSKLRRVIRDIPRRGFFSPQRGFRVRNACRALHAVTAQRARIAQRKRQLRAYGAALSTTRHSHPGRRPDTWTRRSRRGHHWVATRTSRACVRVYARRPCRATCARTRYQVRGRPAS